LANALAIGPGRPSSTVFLIGLAMTNRHVVFAAILTIAAFTSC